MRWAMFFCHEFPSRPEHNLIAMHGRFRFTDVRSWRRFLLHEPIAVETASELPLYLRQVAQTFQSDVAARAGDISQREMDVWYASSVGQQTLKAAFEQLWSEMSAAASDAMPAHDARHAMFKVPAATLEYVTAEGAEGWERLGLIGSVLHDYGRWAEERIWGGPRQSLVHARLSYLLGKEVLDRFDMPPAVRDQVLLAAIRHTSGADPQAPMPLKLVVSADREQLVGSEVVLRLLHHSPLPNGDLSSFCRSGSGSSVLDRLFHFASTLIEGPLCSRRAHMQRLHDDLIDVLLLSEDENASRIRFAGFRQSVTPDGWAFDWRRRWRAAQDIEIVDGDAGVCAKRLLSAPNVAPGKRHLGNALLKLPAANDEQFPRVARALTYAERLRASEDARQWTALAAIAGANAGDLLVTSLSERLMASWSGERGRALQASADRTQVGLRAEAHAGTSPSARPTEPLQLRRCFGPVGLRGRDFGK